MNRADINNLKKVNIGSRKSKLAMIQTNIVKSKLEELYPSISFEIKEYDTIGDQILDKPLASIGKSLFTKTLEDGLLADVIDIAVHSLKDMNTSLPDGLVIGAVCEREDPRDVVVFNPKYESSMLKDLPENSIIGTSSQRRIGQLSKNYPHLIGKSVRGNLQTRFKKLEEKTGDNRYDALILAAAGVIRSNLESKISQYLDSKEWMYAVGQGALAIECRSLDSSIIKLLEPLNHTETLYQVAAERAFMARLEGGCSIPIGVLCSIEKDKDEEKINLTGGLWNQDGSKEMIFDASSIFTSKNSETEISNGSSAKRKNDTSYDCCEPKRLKLNNNDTGKESGISTLSENVVTYSSMVFSSKISDNGKVAHELGNSLAKTFIANGAKSMLDKIRSHSDNNKDFMVNRKIT